MNKKIMSFMMIVCLLLSTLLISGCLEQKVRPTLNYYPKATNLGSLPQGYTITTTFQIWNSRPKGQLNYSITESNAYITVTPLSGYVITEKDTITIELRTTGLAAGSYVIPLYISTNGGSGTFTLSFTITGSGTTITCYQCQGTTEASQTVAGTTCPSGWYNTHQNCAGVPQLSYIPTSYNFGTMTPGSTSSVTFMIKNNGVGTLTYSLSESASWVTISPTSGSSTGEQDTILVSITTSGLTSGSYSCPISITSNGGTGVFTASVIISSTTPTGARLQKMVICYSGRISSSTIANYIANTAKFDLIDTDVMSGTSTIPNIIKAANPNCKVLTYVESMSAGGEPYWSTLNSHEDWFIHTTSGLRIERTTYPGEFLMNPNPTKGYTSYMSGIMNGYFTTYPYCDGIFFDDHIDSIESGVWGPYNFDQPFSSFGDSYSNTNYISWRHAQATAWRAQVNSNKLLMSNCFSNTVMGEATGNVFYEHYVKPRSSESKGMYNTDGMTAAQTLSSIDVMYNSAKKGAGIATNSGCSGETTSSQAEEWAKYVYACLAFAAVDLSKTYFSWEFMGSSPTTNPTWYSFMDMSLGAPIDTSTSRLHLIPGTSYVYYRTFGNYYVIANLDSLTTSKAFIGPDGLSHTLTGKHALFIQR